jgi:DNA polymerase
MTAGDAIGGNIEGAWEALRGEAAGCTRCDLYRCATQTVFGEGPLDARMVFVGEQPGDQEDLAGRPFVGPAGKMFDRAVADAGIDRGAVYVTNAVKHFKFERRGKRRIHSKPDAGEIAACRWWYAHERRLIRPAMTVALGVTAARQMMGKSVTIKAMRGRAIELAEGGLGWITIHPSFLLRMPDRNRAADEYAAFIEDLKGAAKASA